MTVPAHRIAFGEHLRELRQVHGWPSQEAFAHHVGLDRTYISGLERSRRNPTLDVIVRLARGLDVHPSELLATIPKCEQQDSRT
ncbi:helix-turn-helix domain-containing protein [Microbacterium galbinum]|uniref:Helix-turn-helix domain-containing protein n=1 Tax=Microbacterium galbinum TaxID=2851646 RepID=A0ABY4ISS5_9MICO|nr:helix-turn-helix domain-containing protein [Microbacterium galbinum]